MIQQLFALKVQTAYWYDFSASLFRGVNLHYSQLLGQMSHEETSHSQLILAQLEGGVKVMETPVASYHLPEGEDLATEDIALGLLDNLIDLETHVAEFLQTSEIAKTLGELVAPAFLSAVSGHHLSILMEMRQKMEDETVNLRVEPAIWKCLHCGYVMGPEENAPEVCPLCLSGQNQMRCNGVTIDN